MLTPERPLLLYASLAKQIGVEEAIAAQRIAEREVVAADALLLDFPFWSADKIKKVIGSLVKKGIVVRKTGHLSINQANLEGVIEVQVSSPKEETSSKPEDDDAVQEVWDYFVLRCSPRSTTLTPSRARLIRVGLGEASVEECKQAIDGLVEWQKKRGGELELSRVFKTRPGGSPLREQIDWFISQSEPITQAGSTVPSAEHVRVRRAEREVRAAHDLPNSDQAQRIGRRAREWLAEKGCTVGTAADGSPTFDWSSGS